jgi:hypothetical protein
MSAVRVAVAVLILGACLASARPRAQADSPLALLERYALGDFDAVVERLQSLDTAEPLLDRLRRDGPAWLDAGGAADRSRRRLAAATFALEAARVHAWREWKWLLNPPPYGGPLPTLYWKPAPLLIEWGFSRTLRVDRLRVRANLDVHNIFNAGNVLNLQRQFGPTYLNVLQIMGGRLIKVGAQIDF